MGRKIEVQGIVNNILILAQQFLRSRRSGVHGMCHACHTLDTPLEMSTDQDWIRTEAYFDQIRTGSDSNFFENCGSGLD